MPGWPPEPPKGMGAPIFKLPGSSIIGLQTDPRFVHTPFVGWTLRTTSGPSPRPLTLGEAWHEQQREQQNLRAAGAAWAAEQARKRRTENKYTPSSFVEKKYDPRPSPTTTTSRPNPARQSAERPSAPPVQVESLRFFESAHSFPEEGDRLFTTTFSRSVTRFIWFFLEMHRQPTPHDQRIHAWNRYYNIDGRLLCENNLDGLIEASCDSWGYEEGYGWDQPGNWKPGTYRVEIGIDGGVRAKGSFMIV